MPHLQAIVEDVLVRETRNRGWCSDALRIGEKMFKPRVGTVFVDSDGKDCNGREALDADGYGLVSGLNGNGRDREGYNAEGRDIRGFDREGLDQWGIHRDDPARFRFDALGFDAEGFDRQGFDVDGFNREGYDRMGFNADGFNAAGQDRDGYNRENGIDVRGRRRDEENNWYLVDMEAYRAYMIAHGNDYAETSNIDMFTASGGYVEGLGVEGATLPAWWDAECDEYATREYESHARMARSYNPRRRTAPQNLALYKGDAEWRNAV